MPSLHWRDLPDHLSTALKPLYVIFGDELFLAVTAKDSIREAAKQKGFHEREVLQVEGHFDWSRLREAAGNVSLFSSLKILEINLPSGKPGTEGAKSLESFAQTLPEDTVTIISLPKLDKTQQQSKWFKALSLSGQLIEVKTLSRLELTDWIKKQLLKQEQQIEEEALLLFVDQVEGNMLAARQEIEKLGLLFPTGKLTFENIQEVVANVSRFDPFDLSVAWMKGDGDRVYRIIANLENSGDSPVLLLWVLAEDIRALLRFYAGQKSGRLPGELFRELRIWGPKQALVQPCIQRLGMHRLLDALQVCALVDQQIKGAASGEPWRTLAALSVGLCGKHSALALK